MDILHETLEGLDNRSAHAALYRRVMEKSDDFDYFIKLDADMVFTRTTAVREIADVYAADPSLSHAVFPVWDHFTDTEMIGLHTFDGRVSWDLSDEELFVDPNPETPGVTRTLGSRDVPILVDHAPNPSPFQAFHFGVHRALKAFQPGRRPIRLSQVRAQSHVLAGVWAKLLRRRDWSTGWYVVQGAEAVRRGLLGSAANEKADEEVLRLFSSLTSTREGRHPEIGRMVRTRLFYVWPLSLVTVWRLRQTINSHELL